MAKSPRVMVSIKPQQYEVLSRLAAASDQSMSSILAELWDVSAPVMARVAHMLEEARAAKESVREGIREATEAAAKEIRPQAEKVLLTFDLFEQAMKETLADARSVDGGGGIGVGVAGDGSGGASPPSSNTGVRYQKPRGSQS